MRVATPDAATQIDARVPLQAYRALVAGATAQVELDNGSVISATLQQGTVTVPQDGVDDVVQVVLLPQTDIDASLIGTPVSVTVGTADANPAVAFIRELVSQGANR